MLIISLYSNIYESRHLAILLPDVNSLNARIYLFFIFSEESSAPIQKVWHIILL